MASQQRRSAECWLPRSHAPEMKFNMKTPAQKYEGQELGVGSKLDHFETFAAYMCNQTDYKKWYHLADLSTLKWRHRYGLY